MSVSQRVDFILNLKKISQKEFADMVGVHKNTIQKMIMKNSDPSLKVISTLLLKYPELNYTWLLFGDGKMLIDDTKTNNVVIEDKKVCGKFITQSLELKLRELEERIMTLEKENKELRKLEKSIVNLELESRKLRTLMKNKR